MYTKHFAAPAKKAPKGLLAAGGILSTLHSTTQKQYKLHTYIHTDH